MKGSAVSGIDVVAGAVVLASVEGHHCFETEEGTMTILEMAEEVMAILVL